MALLGNKLSAQLCLRIYCTAFLQHMFTKALSNKLSPFRAANDFRQNHMDLPVGRRTATKGLQIKSGLRNVSRSKWRHSMRPILTTSFSLTAFKYRHVSTPLNLHNCVKLMRAVQ